MSLKIYYANGLVFELPQLALWALIALCCVVVLSAVWAATAATHVGHIRLPGTDRDDEEDQEEEMAMAQQPVATHARTSSLSFAPVSVHLLSNRSPPQSPIAVDQRNSFSDSDS